LQIIFKARGALNILDEIKKIRLFIVQDKKSQQKYFASYLTLSTYNTQQYNITFRIQAEASRYLFNAF